MSLIYNELSYINIRLHLEYKNSNNNNDKNTHLIVLVIIILTLMSNNEIMYRDNKFETDLRNTINTL